MSLKFVAASQFDPSLPRPSGLRSQAMPTFSISHDGLGRNPNVRLPPTQTRTPTRKGSLSQAKFSRPPR